jgi:preprotein translocase subunit SecG
MPPLLLDYIVPTVHVMACLFLIVVVLLQTGKGADMGAVFGGGSQTLFGSSGAGNFLTKLTTGIAVLFMLTSLVLTYGRSRSAADNLLQRLPDSPAAAPADEAATPPAAGDAAVPAGEQAAGDAAAPAGEQAPTGEAGAPPAGAPAPAVPGNEPPPTPEPQAAAPGGNAVPAAETPPPAAPAAP